MRDARAVGRWRKKTRARVTARARETTTEGVGVSEKRDAEGVDCERRDFRASGRLTERAARRADAGEVVQRDEGVRVHRPG